MARILLAEDNRVTAEMMRVRLTHAGHEVIQAWNGREALELLVEPLPDLILLDMMMPEIDGVEVLRRVKQDAVLGSIPVLVVSARSHEDDVLAALSAGADDYVTKPLSLRELLARVDRILAQGPEPLRIAVQGDNAPATVGEVVAADARSATVRFHLDGAPRFAIGDSARLSLSSPALEKTIVFDAKVIARGESEPHRTYEFKLKQRGKPAREMTRAFLNLIGRRGAVRVRPDPDEPVPVQVLLQAAGESHELHGELADISTGGARLVLKANADRLLHQVDTCEVRLQLPGGSEPLALTVAICYRSACSGGVTYGIRFDAERSPCFLEQQEQISTFVLEHMT